MWRGGTELGDDEDLVEVSRLVLDGKNAIHRKDVFALGLEGNRWGTLRKAHAVDPAVLQVGNRVEEMNRLHSLHDFGSSAIHEGLLRVTTAEQRNRVRVVELGDRVRTVDDFKLLGRVGQIAVI